MIYDDLSSPLTLRCGAIIPNRLAKAAMAEGLGDVQKRPTNGLVRLYRRWAEGGVGLSITGNVMVDRRHTSEDGNVVVEDERDLPMLTSWATAGKSGGGQIWMQLNHPGRQTPRSIDAEPVAPSAVPLALGRTFAVPRALTVSEIDDIVARFAIAAKLARQAGFDGVELHAAHGYLISQFLSPLSNLRIDTYGGTPENRRRFLLEIVAAVRAAVGPSFPIGVKLNSADFQRGGFAEDESLAVVHALERAGVDLLEVSGGTYEQPAMTGVKASTRAREGYFLAFAERVRTVSKIPLLLTGGFRTRDAMADAVASGKVDVIGLARPLAVNPDFPAALLASGHATAPKIAFVRTGITAVDSLAELSWYQWQLGAMARGMEPDRDVSAFRAIAMYLARHVARVIQTALYRKTEPTAYVEERRARRPSETGAERHPEPAPAA